MYNQVMDNMDFDLEYSIIFDGLQSDVEFFWNVGHETCFFS
jgi:hypothetical protein